ncbi:glycosyltransferase family 2 protein [Lichenicola sp.]|uniref:glycosyltransferase family 2 protein n=1 Tax=Lichenicola sp. TaxID=2804529 RepID=UPI003B007E34
MKAPLAAVTMAYNEPIFLPVWLRHHGGQVGAANCFVLDHGSTDGSTAAARVEGASVVRIPRSPQDDTRRCGFVSDFCASLLNWYDAVIYTDVDELLVPDPAAYPSLLAFAATVRADEVVTALGFDVVQVPDLEPSLDWGQPIGPQRDWLRFSSAMCKPVLIRRRAAWAPGFHCIDAPPAFRDLFLFHLRYVDLVSGLARLARTRTQPWITPEAGSHQRTPDTRWEGMLRGMAGLPKRTDVTLLADDPLLMAWQARVLDSVAERTDALYRIDLHLSGDELWRLPDRFRGQF